jgi:hypothetical protein
MQNKVVNAKEITMMTKHMSRDFDFFFQEIKIDMLNTLTFFFTNI